MEYNFINDIMMGSGVSEVGRPHRTMVGSGSHNIMPCSETCTAIYRLCTIDPPIELGGQGASRVHYSGN